MRTIARYILFLFTGLIFFSCITTRQVPIDQMEPGKIPLPATVRKVALIARNFRFSVDTLSGYYNLDFRLRKGSRRENQVIDSLATTRSLDNLRKALLESGRFDEVFVYPVGAIKPHVGPKEYPLTNGFIQTICKESETDAVISLEMLSFFYSRNKDYGQDFQPEANVKVTAIWSVYLPEKEVATDRFTHSEVIRWNETSPGNDPRKYELPGRTDAIALACGEAARNYSDRVVPHWTESSRVLVGLNGFEWEQALSYAMNNKWEGAAGIWQKYTSVTPPRIAGIASLNYAVSREMAGDLEEAILWSEKAVSKLKNGEPGRIARNYAALLQQRKLKAARLNRLLKNN